jgi:SEC-C motif-containing protein
MPLYVVDTTHPECDDFRKDKVAWVKDLNRDGMFDSYDFLSLEAGSQEISEDNDKEGFLEFKVNLRANESMGGEIKGQEIVVRERSRFLCVGEPASWLYAGGDVTSDIAGLEDVVLNK